MRETHSLILNNFQNFVPANFNNINPYFHATTEVLATGLEIPLGTISPPAELVIPSDSNNINGTNISARDAHFDNQRLKGQNI